MDGKRKIVILEDNEAFAALLEECLSEFYEVAVGHTGRQGLSICLEGGVDAIVTDIGMPELTGVQMLTEFKKHPSLRSIPVLVVTASHFTHYSREELKRYPQVRGLFCKTVSMEVILDAIKNVLPPA